MEVKNSNMERSDFKIVPKFYLTSSLTIIFYKEKAIESVEIYKNYQTIEDESTKGDSKKPVKLKTSKEKRTEIEINNECERLIKNYINVHKL